MTSGQGGPQDISERVARGFEALVESEQGAVAPARPAAGAGGGGGPAAGAGPASSAPGAVDPAQLAALEDRVQQVMDTMTELVRDELETMRVDLQSSVQQATGDLAEERQELRTQIAKTVGAANKWFVKARDQLLERLDEIAAVAAEAEARAGEAATAANAASAASEAASTAAASAAMAVPAAPAPKAVELVKRELTDDGDEVFEWDVEDDAGAGAGAGAGAAAGRRTPATVDLAVDGSELDALMDPVRGDIQELFGEVSAMGQAVAELRDEVAALTKRVPARPKPVRIDERDIDVIIEAVLVAMAPPPPAARPRKAPAKRDARALDR